MLFKYNTLRAFSQTLPIWRRYLTTSSTLQKQMPPRPTFLPDDEFTEVFLKGSGPGGQKINKTASAVQLKHLPTGLVLKVQATRSRTQNRKIARQMLAERVEELQKGSESRVAVVRDAKIKKKSSSVKKSKRKYRALEEAKKAEEEGNGVGEQGKEEEGGEGDRRNGLP